VLDWAEPVWHLFVVRHPKRDVLQQRLSEYGIGTLIHYPVPPHLSGAYAGDRIIQGSLPITEELANTVLSLPIGPHLTLDEAVQVADVVQRATGQT
jgi:dTDP-4-amino-4,6-dideoxygalactose transaminase